MKSKLKSYFDNIMHYIKNNWDMVVAVLLTVIAFFVMFGPRTFDLYDLDWVNKGGDFTVSYLGSVFYRMDDWYWPPFFHMNMAYPYGTSVICTDGSPLLAIIFKALHTLFGLPANVQFVGPWMFICYVLQAVASVLIFRHAFSNKFLVLIGALFFITAPIMLMRVFVHLNLMPHFILLFSILLWMNNKLGKKQWIYINVLYSLSMLTCPYFLPMITGFFALLWYNQVVRDKTVSYKIFGLNMLIIALVLGVWYYLLGLFQAGGTLSGGGWRGLGMNVVALFNPSWSKSQVIRNITPKADFDADNYFGLGLLALLFISIWEVFALFRQENIKRHWTLSLLLFGCFIFALSPQVKVGTVIVFDYTPGKLIEWIGEVFRYSGRFFWPIWYLLAFFVIRSCWQKMPKWSFVILPALLLVQIWDLYPSYEAKSKFIWEAKPVKVATVGPEWDDLARRYDQAFIFAHNKNYRDIWKWAIRHNKRVNYGFLNSRGTKKPKELVQKVQEQLLNGYVEDPSYFYVIDEDLMKKLKEAAKNSPRVQVLIDKIRHIDSYDILESDEELRRAYKAFNTYEIMVHHRYWNAGLVVTGTSRLYRLLDNGYKDYATIKRLDDKVLHVKWDNYPDEETFERREDGQYYQIVDGKPI